MMIFSFFLTKRARLACRCSDARAYCSSMRMDAAPPPLPHAAGVLLLRLVARCCGRACRPSSACCSHIQHCPHPPYRYRGCAWSHVLAHSMEQVPRPRTMIRTHAPATAIHMHVGLPRTQGPLHACARGDHLCLRPFLRLLMEWNTCNIKHLLQHTSETDEIFKTYACNICV
jgi:hypothetical protein